MLVAFDAAGEVASWAFEGKPGSTALEIGWNVDLEWNALRISLRSTQHIKEWLVGCVRGPQKVT